MTGYSIDTFKIGDHVYPTMDVKHFFEIYGKSDSYVITSFSELTNFARINGNENGWNTRCIMKVDPPNHFDDDLFEV